jgi:glycerol-3-phosphate dehydrogenase
LIFELAVGLAAQRTDYFDRTMNGERRDVIDGLLREPLDALIVGGGIVGAGIARDAAMRGLRVGLVEQYDFASGTSGRSTRLLHGGLRYLAQGRIGQVREASREKRVLHRIAPHLAAPLAFVLPTYRAAPWAPWARWKLRIGVKLYDRLCGGENLGRSSSLDADGARALLPSLDARGLTGAVRYFDGFTSDARLVMDTLRSAARSGAFLLNYCRMEDAEAQGGLWRCSLRDTPADTRCDVTARTVVNAAGPWAPQLRHSSVRLRLTKGVHLVIDGARLPIRDAVVMTEGRRILFAIPWGERVILGTTDTDYDGVIEEVRTEPEDARYVLDVVNTAFPDAWLTESDVISDWAGLRPLLADPRDGPFDSPRGRPFDSPRGRPFDSAHDGPSDISRAHEIREPSPGWFDVVGGKLTTYRLMAEQTVDRIARRLGRTVAPCSTAEVRLLSPEETAGVSAIVPPEPSRAVVEHLCRNEWAVHLDDVMIRRTSWHYYFVDAASIAEQVAVWMGEIVGWDENTRRAELERYCALRTT